MNETQTIKAKALEISAATAALLPEAVIYEVLKICKEEGKAPMAAMVELVITGALSLEKFLQSPS